MKILFLYLNSDTSDSLTSVNYVKEQTFFLKYLSSEYVAKLELEPSNLHLIPFNFKEVICGYDLNYENLKVQLSRFDKMIILSSGESKYSEFLEKISSDIKIISISLDSIQLVDNAVKYDIKHNPTFLPAYGFAFNKIKQIENTQVFTDKDSEIPASLIYKMNEFSFIRFIYCLLNQTMPVINSVYFRQDYFYNYPDLGKIVHNKLIYTKYDNKYEKQLIDSYQEIMKSIFMTKDWNRMMTEETYKNELKKVLK